MEVTTQDKPTWLFIPEERIDPKEAFSDAIKINEENVYRVMRDYLNEANSLYSQRVFRKAGKLLDILRVDPKLKKDGSIHVEKIKFHDEEEQRQALELAQATLPYQAVLDNVLDEIRFFIEYPELMRNKGVVIVMLYDYVQRRFQTITFVDGEIRYDKVQKIADALLKRRTAINAAIARQRIEHNALTVEQLLPEELRYLVDVAPALPQYVWVNHFKTNVPEVIEVLQMEGFRLYSCKENLGPLGFCRDSDCFDLLVFHPECRSKLLSLNLVQAHYLVIQRKSCCLGPYLLASILHNHALENDTQVCVLLNQAGQGWSAAHLASLLGHEAIILACEPRANTEELQERMNSIGATNVKICKRNFLDCSSKEPLFEPVSAILVTPDCTYSGVCDPADYIFREGGDLNLLRDLLNNLQDESRLESLRQLQMKMLQHALLFPNTKIVLYSTHSLNPSENEEIVESALETINEEHRQTVSFQRTNHQIQTEMPPDLLFKLDPGIESSAISINNVGDPYLKTEPSLWWEGFFLAIIRRQPSCKVAPREIIKQAKAKGLLNPGGRSKVNLATGICTLHKTRLEACLRCQHRGVFDGPPIKSQYAQSYRIGSKPSGKPEGETMSKANNPHRHTKGGNLHHGVPSPASNHPFPVFRSRKVNQRPLYPIATKLLHLPGIGPPVTYPIVFSPPQAK